MIWLGRPYSNSLDKAGLVSLSERRAKVSTGFVQKITPDSIIYNLIHRSVVESTGQYNLRPGRTKYPIQVTTERFKNLWLRCNHKVPDFNLDFFIMIISIVNP